MEWRAVRAVLDDDVLAVVLFKLGNILTTGRVTSLLVN